MRQRRLTVILMLALLSHYSHGQSNRFDWYNGLINKRQDELLRTIENERRRKIERIEKGTDSVKLVLRKKSPRETFTFFIINDILRYVGVTLFKVTTTRLETTLASQFETRPLENLKGDIFGNYTNDKHYCHWTILEQAK